MNVKYRNQLPDFMRELDLPMIAAEIGVAEGNFSKDLLAGGIDKLYLVDIWKTESVKGDGSSPQEWHDKNYSNMLKHIEPYKEKSVVLKGFSEAMSIRIPDGSLGMVYLDAGHSYDDVFKDLTVWIHKLVPGGIMAGHDYLARQYGVWDAVHAFTNGKYKVMTIPENKDEDAGFYFINK
jgi:hypothetical protein